MTDEATETTAPTTAPTVSASAEAPSAEATSAEASAAASAALPSDGPKVVEGSEGYLIEVDGEIVPNYDATITVFTEGDIVTGKVVRIDKDEVLVDIGYKSEGVIPVNELSIRKNVNTADEVQLGEEIDALVMQKEDADGRLILSKKRARFEKAWKRIEEAHETGTPVQGTVIEVVKGGLILDLGVRGFLPASLVDIRRVQDLSEYVGQQLNCRVIEMNRNRNNVVLSRRAVLEEERKEVRQQIIDELNVGDIVEGTISNIVDFGAFVDLDGIDGLIHISELSWTHINHPSEVLQVNQKVKVKVLDIDRDRQRISLGLKQTQEDPWQKIVARHKVGDIVDGRVTKIVAFGAFVEIEPGIDGMVHISDLSWTRKFGHPSEALEKGQEVKCVVLEVNEAKQRISLGIKQMTEDPWIRAIPEKYIPGHIIKGKIAKLTNFGAFVELEPDLEGLLHISELADHKIDKPQDVVKPDDEVEVKILKVDPEARKIGLSLRRVQWAQEEHAAPAPSSKVQPVAREESSYPSGGDTLGITLRSAKPAPEKKDGAEG